MRVPRTGLLPATHTKAQINPGLSLWLDEKRGSRHADEGDQVSGDGWAELQNDGSLAGEISYHNGDETTFKAAPWATSSTAC